MEILLKNMQLLNLGLAIIMRWEKHPTLNGWKKTEGLCDNAWKCMQEYVIALAHGAESFYDGELLDKHAFVASCNDGFRPVIFLL